MSTRKITPEVRQRIISLREAGRNIDQIKAMTKVSQSTISRTLSERKRIIAAAERGETVKADPNNGIIPARSTAHMLKMSLAAKAKRDAQKAALKINDNTVKPVEKPVLTELLKTQVIINYNGLNIHVEKEAVTDVFLSDEGIKVITK